MKKCDECVDQNGKYCQPCEGTYVIDIAAKQRRIVSQCDPEMYSYVKSDSESVCLRSCTDGDLDSVSLVQLFDSPLRCAPACESDKYEFIWACEITCNGFLNGTHKQKCVPRECDAKDQFTFDSVSYCLTCGADTYKTVDEELTFKCMDRQDYVTE